MAREAFASQAGTPTKGPSLLPHHCWNHERQGATSSVVVGLTAPVSVDAGDAGMSGESVPGRSGVLDEAGQSWILDWVPRLGDYMDVVLVLG